MAKLFEKQLAAWRESKTVVHAFSDRSTRLSGVITNYDDDTIELTDGEHVTIMQHSKCMNITTKAPHRVEQSIDRVWSNGR